MGRLLDALASEGIQRDIFLSFEPVSGIYHAHDYPFGISNRRHFVPLWDIATQKGFNLLVGGPVSSYTYCLQQTCQAYTVDPSGDLYPCTGFLGDKKHCIGTIDGSGEWHKICYEYYDWLARDPLSMSECRECKALPICCGGCARKAHQKYGVFSEPYCDGFDNQSFLEAYIRYHLSSQPFR